MAATLPGDRARLLALPRMDVRLAIGVALVAIAVAGGLVLWDSVRETEPVLVASRYIPSGHVLGPGDVEVARARLEGPAAGLAVPAADLALVEGRTATGPIHAGELVVAPDLGDGPSLGPGEAAVTVPVEDDRVYPLLRRGDSVSVLGTTSPGQAGSATQTLLERAVVFDLALAPSRITLGGDDDEGVPVNVTLVVPRGSVETIAHALVNGRVTLVLLSRADTGGPR